MPKAIFYPLKGDYKSRKLCSMTGCLKLLLPTCQLKLKIKGMTTAWVGELPGVQLLQDPLK